MQQGEAVVGLTSQYMAVARRQNHRQGRHLLAEDLGQGNAAHPRHHRV